MEMTVDLASPRYPYLQIADQLRAKIMSGEITDRLPSLWDIVEMTHPHPAYNTVRRAVGVLKKEGLIETAPGHGTFVRRDPS